MNIQLSCCVTERIFLTLSRHPSLSPIALGRSPRSHLVSAQNCCTKVRASRPTFACSCEGVNRSISTMSSSLLLQQCPVCLVPLTWLVFVMGGRWLYTCFVMCCLHVLFNIARCILVELASKFFSIRLVSVQVVHPYSSIDTTTAEIYFIGQFWIPYDRFYH